MVYLYVLCLVTESEKKHTFFEEVNEGEQIKKTTDLFKKRLMRGEKKKQSKNITGQMFFISSNELVFLRIFFYQN